MTSRGHGFEVAYPEQAKRTDRLSAKTDAATGLKHKYPTQYRVIPKGPVDPAFFFFKAAGR
jgi:hypothetical protein